MALVKRTEEGQKWRKERIAELESRLSKAKRISGLKAVPEWGDLKSMLDSFVEFAERELKIAVRDCRKSEFSDSEIRRKICEIEQKKDDFKFVVDLVEKSEEQVAHLLDAINSAKKELKDLSKEVA